VRVLVVEDEVVLAAAVARGLRHEGMAVDVSHDGADALAKLDVNRYDVVVLDRDLPGVHGDQVCRILAGQAAPTRILMLTASGTVNDRVDGLTLALSVVTYLIFSRGLGIGLPGGPLEGVM
jgi:DNA-binding response OmpR family regulator